MARSTLPVFLGIRHDPWQVRQDPNLPNFHVDALGLAAGLGVELLSELKCKRVLLGSTRP